MKQYKTNEELLEYLESKNVTIKNKKSALKNLEKYTYYSIINSYKYNFKDSNNNWDNNTNQNYIFPIEKQQLSLMVQENSESGLPARRLRKSYIWSKKIRLAIYKVITYLPKIISGNYKRKVNE